MRNHFSLLMFILRNAYVIHLWVRNIWKWLTAVRWSNLFAQLFACCWLRPGLKWFLCGNLWQILQDCATSCTGGWHARNFTLGTTEVGGSSVWVETSDWYSDWCWYGASAGYSYSLCGGINTPWMAEDQCIWLKLVLGFILRNIFWASRREVILYPKFKNSLLIQEN
jgi:hypothetical protein